MLIEGRGANQQPEQMIAGWRVNRPVLERFVKTEFEQHEYEESVHSSVENEDLPTEPLP